MILKLMMPHVNGMVQGGSIAQWFKAEGERVNYGEDLFDLKVEIRLRRAVRSLSEDLKSLAEGKELEADSLRQVEERPSAVFLVRITSSDMGIMRRIYTQDGAHYRVGDLLAMLTTDENEPFDGPELAASKASLFRVVPAPVQPS